MSFISIPRSVSLLSFNPNTTSAYTHHSLEHLYTNETLLEYDASNRFLKSVPYLTMTSRANTLLQHPPKMRESIKGNSGAIMLANEASVLIPASLVMVSVKKNEKTQQLLLN